jgi:two-component system LytT family response regulator
MKDKLKALIVDDELSARENLACLLETYCPDVCVAGTCSSVEDAAVFVARTAIDILFLDINFGAASGFDLLAKLPLVRPFQVIFVTAHDQYALDAFKVNALDYLLKPVSRQELIRCVAKCTDYYKGRSVDPGTALRAGSEEAKIVVAGKTGSDIVAVSALRYLQASGSYTILVLKDGRELYSSRNLKSHLAEIAAAQDIIRIHKSYAVNKHCIVRVIKSPFARIVLDNDLLLPLSDLYKQDVYQQLLQGHLNQGKEDA